VLGPKRKTARLASGDFIKKQYEVGHEHSIGSQILVAAEGGLKRWQGFLVVLKGVKIGTWLVL